MKTHIAEIKHQFAWYRLLSLTTIWVVFFAPEESLGANTEECLECHGEKGLEREEGGSPDDLFVDPKTFPESIHGKLSCTGCHKNAILVDYEHKKKLKKVSN